LGHEEEGHSKVGSSVASPRNRLKRKSSLLLASLVAVLVALLLIAGGGNLLAAGEGKSLAAKSLAMLRDPLSILGDRSPGERAAGALFNTKPDRVKSGDESPVHERVLSTVRDRPLIDLPALNLAPPAPPMLPDQAILPPGLGLPGDPIFEPMIPSTPFPPLAIGPFPGGPGPGSGGGGGGTVNPPGGGVGVPEPATWAMMILGFFAAGAAMRRGKRGSRAVEEEAPASSSC
jgi:hypothetical protein